MPKTILLVESDCPACAEARTTLGPRITAGEIEIVQTGDSKAKAIVAQIQDLKLVPECIVEENGKFSRCDIQQLLAGKTEPEMTAEDAISIYTTRLNCDDGRAFEILAPAFTKEDAIEKSTKAQLSLETDGQIPKGCAPVFTEEVGPVDVIEVTDAAKPITPAHKEIESALKELRKLE